MNIHHLELFHHVAKHGGISAAARNMPYGIQQPAISAQLLQLEDHLGVTLFRRRPFELTPEGRELHAFIEPFFGGLDEMEGRLRKKGFSRLRIGAGKTVLKSHLPAVLASLREEFPGLSPKLREASEARLFEELHAGELDLIITALQRDTEPGVTIEPLVELPLALAVSARVKFRTAAELLESDPPPVPLIALLPEETAARVFQSTLERRGVVWPPAFEVSTVELVLEYVAAGFGAGVVVDGPGLHVPKGVRLLPLPDFPKVRYGVAWKARLSPVAEALRERLHRYAASLAGAGQSA